MFGIFCVHDAGFELDLHFFLLFWVGFAFFTLILDSDFVYSLLYTDRQTANKKRFTAGEGVHTYTLLYFL